MSRHIDANKLIEFINSKFVVSWKHDYDGGFKDACVEILNAIEDAPSIDIDRPQGEWIEHWYPHFDVAGIECSICGKDVPYWERNYDMPRYCPNCGADMRGDNDGKDIQSADE